MSATTLNPIENAKEAIKSAFHKAVNLCYGTRKRSNITIGLVFALLIAAKLLESYAFVPYCGV